MGYYVTTKKVEIPVSPQVQENTNQNSNTNWKNTRVDIGPDLAFEFKYPSDWSSSELKFPCENVRADSIGFISPTKTDLPGYIGMSVAYLLQYCIYDKAVIAYQGFIKAPLSRQPIESDKILLSDADLKRSSEYQVAQQIISSQVFKNSNQ